MLVQPFLTLFAFQHEIDKLKSLISISTDLTGLQNTH